MKMKGQRLTKIGWNYFGRTDDFFDQKISLCPLCSLDEKGQLSNCHRRWICYGIISKEYEVNYSNIRKSGWRKMAIIEMNSIRNF